MNATNSPLRFDLGGGATALFTERAHGNLSSVAGEGAEHGHEARERLRRIAGVERLVRGYQVHGRFVRRLDAATVEDPDGVRPADADGQATALTGVGVMVLGADCLPVVLGARGAVAALHAGWRGLAEGVLEEGVRVLEDMGGASEVVAIIGPGAGVCCYEVGEEVHGAFGGNHRDGTRIDLKAIARERLLAAGVSEVRDLGLCTICDERFFSHRREGERAGRQGGVAWLS